MSAPRHRLEPVTPGNTAQLPVINYDPPIPLRASDFDAVAPTPRPARPDRRSPVLETSDALYLAHS